MKECKHRWIDMPYGKQYRQAGQYMYHCAKCGQARFVVLTSAAPKDTP